MTDEESTRVLGLGLGLFLIILIWSLALAGLLFITRLNTGSSVGILVTASLLTLLLLVIPRQDRLVQDKVEEEEIEPSLPTDGMFIWRTIMVILSSLSAITGMVVVALDYAMHQVKFKPTNSKKLS